MTKHIKIVSTVEQRQCQHLDDFLTALWKVDYLYYTYTAQLTSTNSKKRKRYVTKYPERVFAYEVYHQLRKIMEKKKYEYKDVYLNGEQTKSRVVVPELETCAPDLIMHKKLYDYQPEDQLWLCEIKMQGNRDALSDFEKFKDMQSLNFRSHIFLYAGVRFAEMFKQVKRQKKKLNSIDEVVNNVICISTYNDSMNKEIHCHTLREILDSKTSKDLG